MKKAIPFLLAVILTATFSISGTVAFLQTANQGETTTSSGLKISQFELERKTEGGTELQAFSQNQSLSPAVGTAEKNVSFSWETQIGLEKSSSLYGQGLSNAIDKFVFVKNEGGVGAYVRTWFAFEQGSYEGNLLQDVIILNKNETDWDFTTVPDGTTIDGIRYAVVYADYKTPLAAGQTSAPSLLQFYMNGDATQEDAQAIDGNGDGEYEIIVISQAADTAELRNSQFTNPPFGNNAE